MRRRTRLSPAGYRRTRRRWLKGGALVLLFLILLGGVSYATHRPEWRIQTVRVTGAETVPSGEVREAVEQVLAQARALRIFARDNVVLYPRQRLRDHLQAEFPRLREFSFSTAGLNELRVGLRERRPYGVYCGDSPAEADPAALVERQDCLLLDRDGLLFSASAAGSSSTSSTSSTNSLAADDRFLAFFDHWATSTTAKPGERYLPAVFPDLVDLLDKLPERELEPRRVVRYQPDSLRVELASDRHLLLDLEADLERTWRDLDLLLERGRPGSEIGDLSDFLYIDLRFGDRVFYKLSDEAGEGSEEEETTAGADPALESDPATSTAGTSTDAAAGTTSEEQ